MEKMSHRAKTQHLKPGLLDSGRPQTQPRKGLRLKEGWKEDPHLDLVPVSCLT